MKHSFCQGCIQTNCDMCAKLELYQQGRADAIKEVECEMYHQAFNIDHEEDGLQKWDNGNWIRYKLFENVIIKLKEQK